MFVFVSMSAKGRECLTHGVKSDYPKSALLLSVSVPPFYSGINMSVFNT